MDNDITITTRLLIPRTPDATGYPVAWVRDKAVSHAATGLLMHVTSLIHPEDPIDAGDLPNHPDDVAALPGLVAELVQAGYLLPRDDDGYRYELVNPDRLPPWPA